MKVLFITMSWPKKNNSNMYTELMSEFIEREHEVTVIALNEKRNNQNTYISVENMIKVLRVKCGNIQKTNKYEKVISSFVAGFQIERAVNKFLSKEDYSLVIFALPPHTITPSIVRIKRRFNSKLYVLLKEFWPQDPTDLGAMKKGGMVWRVFRYLEMLLYKNADYIGTMSEAGIRYVEANNKNVSHKLEVCPNSQKPKQNNIGNRNQIREKYNIPTDKCVFVFGGNLGLSQGIDEMIASIKSINSRSDVFFLIIGDGTEFSKVVRAFENEREDFIKIYPSITQKEFEKLVSACDVGLIFLNKDYTIPNIPSRLVSYLLAELPILAAVDKTTDVGDIIEEYECGIKLYNGDIPQFISSIERMSNPEVRSLMSRNSRKLLLEKYTTEKSYEIIMKHFN
jgi:glycosyltransferase involved in cell wall biosynthesis